MATPLDEKRRLAAAAIARYLDTTPTNAETFAADLVESEIDALIDLPDDPAAAAAVRLICRAARIRGAAEPLVRAAWQFADSLELNERELAAIASQFDTAPAPPIEVIGPRRAPMPRRTSQIVRKIGDE